MVDIYKVKQYIADNELDGDSRLTELVYKRSYLYKYLRAETSLSLDAIGKMFNRKHSTIVNGLDIYENNKRRKAYLFCVSDLIAKLPIRSQMQIMKDAFASNDTILVSLTKKEYLRLSRFRVDNNSRNNEQAIKLLINQIIH